MWLKSLVSYLINVKVIVLKLKIITKKPTNIKPHLFEILKDK